MQTVELLQKLDRGISVCQLCEIYGVGSSTIYDLKKQKDKLLRYYRYVDTDTKKGMEKRNHMKAGKHDDLEECTMQWFHHRRNDGVQLSGDMIMTQAKKFHEQLQLDGPCSYSSGWLHRFKLHGI